MNKTNYNYGVIDMTHPENNVINADKHWIRLTEQTTASFNERVDIALNTGLEYLVQVDLDPVLSIGSSQFLITSNMIDLNNGAMGWSCGNLNNFAGGGVFINPDTNFLYFVFNSEQHSQGQAALSEVYFTIFYR